MDLRDVSYYVNRKQGFPKLKDIGVLDIFLGGTGLSFKMKMSTADKKDQQNFFKVDKVDVDVKNFNIKVKQSKHKFLFAIAKSVIIKALRPALQKAIEKQIKDQVHQLDSLAYQIKLEADRAQKEVSNNSFSLPYFPNSSNRSLKTPRMLQISTADMSPRLKSISCRTSSRQKRRYLRLRSTWPSPSRTLSSPIFIYQVESPLRPPSTRKSPWRETNGNLLSSSWVLHLPRRTLPRLLKSPERTTLLLKVV